MVQRYPIHAPHQYRSCRRFFISGREDAIQASLELLGELKASLELTQKAVLARDLNGLEQRTREQLRWRQALAVLWAESRHGANARVEMQGQSPVPAELQAALSRVLHLGRVQSFLLARAQRSLATMAYLLAGPQASYGPSSALSANCDAVALGVKRSTAKCQA
jgi:hypothetical protein